MSMHLERPHLTMSGKKAGKKKYASAAAKQQAEQLEREWEALKAKQYAKPAPAKKRFKTESVAPAMGTARAVSSTRISSLVTPGGSCALKDPQQYTGDKILGIATMHKSNLVPIFSSDEAKAVSSMRR